MTPDREQDLANWQAHRSRLLGLAYRMLGDLARAEEMVQEAWLRFSGRTDEARDVRAYLVTIVTRLCLNELDSARARHEQTRENQLPEPIELASALEQNEALERISMAFLVLLQRLTPAERAVLLLHDVFDFGHEQIAELVGKSPAASRKLLERARANVNAEKRLLNTSREEHARLLQAFMHAATQGDVSALVGLLADDALLITDGGANGRTASGIRNLEQPLSGPARIAAFVAMVTSRNNAALSYELRELNGQPALLLNRDGAPFGVLLLGVAEGRVQRVFFQGDPARLTRLASRSAPP
jgi:RNA polymerase sigma-70 factor (ECF subfamily)